MIEKYIRDTTFFRSLRDRNMTIAHSDLDDNFNSIVDYINKNLRPAINILSKKELLGVDGNPHSFLRNIGSSAVFSRIENRDISKNIISINKFKQLKVTNSVLASDHLQNIKLIKDGDGGKILNSSTVSDNLVSNWSKLRTRNFADKSIKNDKVELSSLTRDHLSLDVQQILDNQKTPQAVDNPHIKEGTIIADKIANSAFLMRKLSQELLDMRKPVRQLVFEKNCFQTRHITNTTLSIRNAFIVTHGRGVRLPKSGLWNILTPKNIPLNAINLGLPQGSIQYQLKVVPSTQLDSTIAPSHIKDRSLNLKTLKPLIWNNANNFKIKKQNLSNGFRGILESRGGLKK